ncbi:MAG: DUF2336 domain-containing protein [Alphaproteobacteria bacterium]|nr:DUF2336 domain-containing protein [Alphaproteobacteria bacterium]
MDDKLTHLESLARLTKENSEDGRQQLLREVTDMFMETPDTLNEREIAYFGEIMGSMVHQVEATVRQHLSETISFVGNAPKDLILSLANDEIEVALPVLKNSDALGDDELVEIAQKHSQEHLNAIAQRAMVGETVTDVLVEKGDTTVLGTLAGNTGAQFSRNGMETFVERAKENENLELSLSQRQDVPADLAQDIYWRVSEALREKILSANEGLDDAQVQGLLQEADKWFAEQKEKGGLTPAEKFIARKDKMKQLDTELLLTLIRQDKIPEFVAGLGRLVNIDPDVVRQAVFDPESEKLAVLCKAAEVDFDVFGEIVYCINLNEETDDKDMEALLGVYQRIDTTMAQRTLRFLRTRLKLQKKT